MKRVDSFNELAGLMRPFLRCPTNNYLMPAEIKRLIEYGSLWYISGETALFLFEKRQGFMKLLFHLTDLSARLPKIQEILVAHTVVKNEGDNVMTKQWLQKQGFNLVVKRILLVAERLNVEPISGEISQATQDEAHELFNRCFDPLLADLPSPGRYGRLLTVRDKDSSVCGIIHIDDPVIIAVNERCRGRGVATKLFSAFAALKDEKRGLFKLWSDENNYAAQNLYRKLGYKPSGLYAEYYTLNTEDKNE